MSPLFVAGLLLATSVAFEVVGNVALRYADGFTRPIAAAVAVTCFVLSIWLMSVTIRKIELGVTYAVWAASSTAITAWVGVGFYDESLTVSKLAGVALIVLGVIVLSSGAGWHSFRRRHDRRSTASRRRYRETDVVVGSTVRKGAE